MPDLFVPPKVVAALQEERQRREAQALDALRAEHRWGWVKEFNHELDRVVPGMKLVWCPDPAPLDAVACGAHPARWNLIWPGFHGGPLSVLALEDGDGGYREPGAWVFDMLARSDLWDSRVQRDQRRIRREAEVARARREERERAERDQDVLDRWLAASRTQVSMNRDVPWSQNAAGVRGRGKKA